MKPINILTWVTEYDVRQDSTLSESSCKQFLEDLLGAVRRGLERTRSTSSSSSKSSAPAGASTPKRREQEPELGRTQSMDEDARYSAKNYHRITIIHKQFVYISNRMILEEDDTMIEEDVFKSANSLSPPGN